MIEVLLKNPVILDADPSLNAKTERHSPQKIGEREGKDPGGLPFHSRLTAYKNV